MYQFMWPVKTLVGNGLIRQIGTHVPPLGNKTVMITGPPDPWVKPIHEQVNGWLQAAGWDEVILFNRIETEPTWTTVDRGVALAKNKKVGAVVAIGGGSTLDASKVIAERSGIDFLCTVPTTSGTGSEINPWAVITDTKTRDKQSVRTKLPDVALLDPELTLNMPPIITLLTGIDAFIHCLECFLSTTANPISDALALQGMVLVGDNLQQTIEHGQDLVARQNMQAAALLGGGAMLGAGLGLMHGIGNVVGGLTRQPHGLILIHLLDAVMEFNEPAEEKYGAIADRVEQLRTLVAEKTIELNLPEIEIREADLTLLAQRAAVNVNSKTNPREYTRDDIVTIAHQSFKIT
ncbi:MAG: iron-containing alcohol dehydrogenase family protein [Candidatus Bipolaricaulia bacterium]